MVIKGTTQLLGVIGYPVEHSFSPLMHNAAIADLGADYAYLPFPIAPNDLERAIAGFSAINLRGFNITIPHKRAIMPLLDEISETARVIGAVNTVWREGNRWHGTNTDAAGFLAPLKVLGRNWANRPAMILGNGGAAQAVAVACAQLGCPEIWVAGRSPDKLSMFSQSWAASPEISARLRLIKWAEIDEFLPRAGLVVNATPIGMHPRFEASPLDQRQVGLMVGSAIAYDLIYTPRPTQFLQWAGAAGITAVDGLEMLIQQGAAALEIWVGQPAPVEIMRQTLLDYLASR
ncbi:MAG: shikimate dehydrogenase [Phormidesmis sp.]